MSFGRYKSNRNGYEKREQEGKRERERERGVKALEGEQKGKEEAGDSVLYYTVFSEHQYEFD